MVRTRFAPSPTGSAHLGSLRTALYEYLTAKINGGKFILRIEDTDQNRYVEGAVELIYKMMELTGLKYDEGPDVGGDYGPYLQSERKSGYMEYAVRLVNEGKAYYCFCPPDNNDAPKKTEQTEFSKYDRRCYHLSKDEIEKNLKNGVLFVIRQLITEGKTTIRDEIYGDITFDNAELDDQILIKSDGMPTYNFANVIDDHLMNITHVVRGNEYITSTPKYNLLYEALGWEIPKYIHLPLLLNERGEKLSKRRGDASFNDLLDMGYLPEAILNYTALLGWSPPDNQEIFTLSELEKVFSIKGLSKSPSSFDIKKLSWFNGEYIKKLPPDAFFEMVKPFLEESVKRPCIDLKLLAGMVQPRVNLASEAKEMFDFIDVLPDYNIELYTHKKMKTDADTALKCLLVFSETLKKTDGIIWENDSLYQIMCSAAEQACLLSKQLLWSVRTALSGKAATPCGASELAALLGREETEKRLLAGIEKLQK